MCALRGLQGKAFLVAALFRTTAFFPSSESSGWDRWEATNNEVLAWFADGAISMEAPGGVWA